MNLGVAEREVEGVLAGEHGEELMRLMSALSLLRKPELRTPIAQIAQITQIGERFGWLDAAGSLTALGWRVADPLREYLWWLERGRAIHVGVFEAPSFGPESLRGKRILELGSGFGCNLLSLARYQPSRLIGIDIEPLYLQFTSILCRLAGETAPNVLIGNAEQLAFEDESFDCLVCLGSIQHMNIQKALAEANRVLAPGGIFFFATQVFSQFSRKQLRRGVLLNPKILAGRIVSLAAMALYPWCGRLTAPGSLIYVSHARMSRWIEAAGFEIEFADPCSVAATGAALYHARKPG